LPLILKVRPIGKSKIKGFFSPLGNDESPAEQTGVTKQELT
jgi:hypothetical protein